MVWSRIADTHFTLRRWKIEYISRLGRLFSV
jgi:hypothetical protein